MLAVEIVILVDRSGDATLVRRRSSSSSCRGTGSVEKEREYRSMKVINILNMAIAMVLVKRK